jgi:hypothetical protein
VWQRGGGREDLYTCCSAARLDRRTPGKSGVMGFLHQMILTIYILNNVPQDYLELTQSSHTLRRLSAKRLGGAGTLGRPTRRSSFLGLMWKPFFRAVQSLCCGHHGGRFQPFQTFQSFQSFAELKRRRNFPFREFSKLRNEPGRLADEEKKGGLAETPRV